MQTTNNACKFIRQKLLFLVIFYAANPSFITLSHANDSTGFTVLNKKELEHEQLLKQLNTQPEGYQDQYIYAAEENSPALSFEKTPEESSEPEGLRFYSIESRTGFADSNHDGQHKQVTETGVRSEYRMETRNLGEIVFQADVRHRSGNDGDDYSAVGSLLPSKQKQGTRVTVRSIGIPVANDVLADSALGDIELETTPAMSRNYRFGLGNAQVRGARTHLYNQKFDLQAGTGKRGELLGGPYPSFETTEGSITWVGLSQRLNDDITFGVQGSQAKDIPLTNSTTGTTTPTDIRSVAASVTWGNTPRQHGDKQLRLTAIKSTLKPNDNKLPETTTSRGVFAEAELQQGSNHHRIGLYNSEPELYSADDQISNGMQGIYWSVDHSSARLSSGGGLDVSKQTPQVQNNNATSKRIAFNSYANYRLDSRHSLGGNINIDQTSSSTANKQRSASLYTYYQAYTRQWGSTRVGATVHRNEELVSNGPRSTGIELDWEQNWLAKEQDWSINQTELTTTLGIARDHSTQDVQTYPTAGLHFRHWINSEWNAAGSLNYSSRTGNLSTSQGLSGNLSSEYALNKDLTLGASLSLNQAKVTVNTIGLTTPAVSRSTDKTAYAYLRWQGSAGRPYTRIGNRTPGKQGSGSIRGQLFLDANHDGIQQTDEAPATHVEVWLDERYQAYADNSGVFEFLSVATGEHRLALNLDSLPLPWGVDENTDWTVDVPLRSVANTRIPIIRLGAQ